MYKWFFCRSVAAWECPSFGRTKVKVFLPITGPCLFGCLGGLEGVEEGTAGFSLVWLRVLLVVVGFCVLVTCWAISSSRWWARVVVDGVEVGWGSAVIRGGVIEGVGVTGVVDVVVVVVGWFLGFFALGVWGPSASGEVVGRVDVSVVSVTTWEGCNTSEGGARGVASWLETVEVEEEGEEGGFCGKDPDCFSLTFFSLGYY